jgi:hypothetical protein
MPVIGTEVGEFEASLTIVRFSDAVPAITGTNVTVNFTAVPAATVTGNVSPDSTNSEPED